MYLEWSVKFYVKGKGRGLQLRLYPIYPSLLGPHYYWYEGGQLYMGNCMGRTPGRQVVSCRILIDNPYCKDASIRNCQIVINIITMYECIDNGTMDTDRYLSLEIRSWMRALNQLKIHSTHVTPWSGCLINSGQSSLHCFEMSGCLYDRFPFET